MRVHKKGFQVIAVTFLIWLALNVSVGMTGELYFRCFTFLTTTLILIFVIRFFRYPRRSIELKPNSVLSPADGQVVAIEETIEPEYFGDHRLQVSVFMSVYNVHVNWIPIPGVVKYFKHHNGRFMAAYLPKSSTDNERATTVIEMADGREVLVRQIAGAVAKRIITYPQVGAIVNQRNELGFIRFGSRVDLFLPVGTKVIVELCQKVTGSQTVIADL
ncbi:MAG: phosphatidylserine decarboxylase family protein [Bacteroidia bacterium]|nr:phosphatidylserine decarboxylase family protein [Bacteroidia bacterium]